MGCQLSILWIIETQWTKFSRRRSHSHARHVTSAPPIFAALSLIDCFVLLLFTFGPRQFPWWTITRPRRSSAIGPPPPESRLYVNMLTPEKEGPTSWQLGSWRDTYASTWRILCGSVPFRRNKKNTDPVSLLDCFPPLGVQKQVGKASASGLLMPAISVGGKISFCTNWLKAQSLTPVSVRTSGAVKFRQRQQKANHVLPYLLDLLDSFRFCQFQWSGTLHWSNDKRKIPVQVERLLTTCPSSAIDSHLCKYVFYEFCYWIVNKARASLANHHFHPSVSRWRTS